MPVLLMVISIDFVVAFSNPETISPLNIVGLMVRYAALFFVGGFIAYLHTSEKQPFKLFELGISAPALITSLVAANGISGPTQPERKTSVNPAAMLFLQIGSAHAAEESGKAATPNSAPPAWSQIVDGITGKVYRQSEQVIANIPLAGGAWVPAHGGSIPGGAVKGGREQAPGAEDLYVCRARLNDGVYPGKVRPAFKGCDVPFGGKEHTISRYEVLTGNYKWVSANAGIIPAGALEAGREAAPGEVLYVCRADYRGGIHPGKVRPQLGGCNISWGGREIKIKSYDVLVKLN